MIYLFLDLWRREERYKYCDNSTIVEINSSYSGQYKCQNECMNENGCIGISWSYREGNGHICFICFDDILYTNDHFGFHRKVDGKHYRS